MVVQTQKNEIKGLEVFRIPSKNDEYVKKWHNDLVQIITRDRMVVDRHLKEQIGNFCSCSNDQNPFFSTEH